jgi:general secretion pathway protein H
VLPRAVLWHPTGRERGFTLIELLVVFAIMGLLIAVVPASFDRMRDGANYRDTLRTMTSDMREARYLAAAEGTEVRFVLDLKQRHFGIDGRSPRALPQALQVRATIASRDLGADGTATIRFLPQGGATGGSIDVARASGAGVRLRVDWLSGQVTQAPLPAP